MMDREMYKLARNALADLDYALEKMTFQTATGEQNLLQQYGQMLAQIRSHVEHHEALERVRG